MRTPSRTGGRRGRIAIGLVLSLTLALGLTAATPALALSESAGRTQILKALNDLRKAQGLKPLIASPALTAVAQKWSASQYDKNTMAHNPSVGTSIPKGWRSWGENVGWALGFANDASTIHQSWVNSPGHYANMTAAKFTHVGIGYAEGSKGAYGTQVFATYPASALPKINNVQPRKVKADKTVKVTIRGRALGDANRIKIGSKKAKIVKKSAKKIVVRVKLSAGKHKVRVRTGLGWTDVTKKTQLRVRG